MNEIVNNNYKDRLFCFIFGRSENRKWTLSLYNAINNTDYDDPDAIEINTLENTVYMRMRNDVSFLLDSVISLYEQQSTYNPNMPLRQLIYLSGLYEKYIMATQQNLYGRKAVSIPVPKLVTLFNGVEQIGDRILKLSDLFIDGTDKYASDVEVTVHMINVRPQYNKELLDKCGPLYEYSWFIEKVRENIRTIRMSGNERDIKKAVGAAIDEMPDTFVIKPFLISNRMEVSMSLITEYDEEKTLAMIYRDTKEEGISEGDLRRVILLICKKLRRHMDIPQIAREIEEDEAYVRPICEVAERFAPEYDEQKIYEALQPDSADPSLI